MLTKFRCILHLYKEPLPAVKGAWHILVIVKEQSHLVYLNTMHNIANLWEFGLNIDHRSCKMCVLSDAYNKKASGLKYFNAWVRNYLFLKNYVTSEGAGSHNFYTIITQLSIARYQIKFVCY